MQFVWKDRWLVWRFFKWWDSSLKAKDKRLQWENLITLSLGLISRQLVLTISVEYGLVRHGCPQLVGCVADVFALVLLQGVHGITECVECGWAAALRNLQLWVTARVKLLSILCPSETWAKKKKREERSLKYQSQKIIFVPLKKKPFFNTHMPLLVTEFEDTNGLLQNLHDKPQRDS